MALRRWVAPWGLLLLSGCLYHATERTDEAVRELAAHPFDLAPVLPAEPAQAPHPSPPTPLPQGERGQKAGPPLDIQTSAFLQADKAVKEDHSTTQPPNRLTAFLQADKDGKADKDAKAEPDVKAEPLPKVPERLPIPTVVPGAETPLIELPADKAKRPGEIRRLYPKLPPIPQEPQALPGPEGRSYTLADLQQIAAANSPQLRQAAADVEAARGNLTQAWTYPNPTFAVQFQPSSDGSTPGMDGVSIDQVIKTGGKLKLQAAAAAKALENADLALRKARSDLATQVRNAYFALLVNLETVRVSKGLASFTDEVYRLQEDLLEHGFGAAYEPAALRAQAYTTRLALKQAISSYMYSWKQLVAVVGLPQLPLSEVVGRIDRAIPYYDYDAVLAYALRNHTDVLSARNTVEQARYNLKLAQVMPIPDVDVNIGLFHDFAVPPFGTTPTASVSIPLPIWDRNKGNIMAAEAALVRASEEPHRVAVTITNNLATAYASYKNNLESLEYYRRFILPDQVRAYRGVYERRRIDPTSAFADLVQAQQTLVTNVTTYLGILGTLWTSVTGVADFLQTDDLFQLAEPQEVPALPDLEPPHWACPHSCSPLADANPIVIADSPGPARLGQREGAAAPTFEECPVTQKLAATGGLSASGRAASHWNDAAAPLAGTPGKPPVAPTESAEPK